MKDKETIKCNAYVEILSDLGVLLLFVDNNFEIIYKSQSLCIFKFIEDLEEKEKQLLQKIVKLINLLIIIYIILFLIFINFKFFEKAQNDHYYYLNLLI